MIIFEEKYLKDQASSILFGRISSLILKGFLKNLLPQLKPFTQNSPEQKWVKISERRVN
jgi:hypothetical protein